VEPRHVGGPGILNPGLLLHPNQASTPVLAQEGTVRITPIRRSPSLERRATRLEDGQAEGTHRYAMGLRHFSKAETSLKGTLPTFCPRSES
jgi:hypothetical protein